MIESFKRPEGYEGASAGVFNGIIVLANRDLLPVFSQDNGETWEFVDFTSPSPEPFNADGWTESLLGNITLPSNFPDKL